MHNRRKEERKRMNYNRGENICFKEALLCNLWKGPIMILWSTHTLMYPCQLEELVLYCPHFTGEDWESQLNSVFQTRAVSPWPSQGGNPGQAVPKAVL